MLLLHYLKSLLLLLLLLDVKCLLLSLQIQVLVMFQGVDELASKASALQQISWLCLTFPFQHLNIWHLLLGYRLLILGEERGRGKKRLGGHNWSIISTDSFDGWINCEGSHLVARIETADLSLSQLAALVLHSFHRTLILDALVHEVSVAWYVQLGEQGGG